jgi:hypothetical protein
MEVSICPSTKKPLKTIIIISELTKNELKMNYEWLNYELTMKELWTD